MDITLLPPSSAVMSYGRVAAVVRMSEGSATGSNALHQDSGEVCLCVSCKMDS